MEDNDSRTADEPLERGGLTAAPWSRFFAILSSILVLVAAAFLLCGAALLVMDWAGGVLVVGRSVMPARAAAVNISLGGAVAAIVVVTARSLRPRSGWMLSVGAFILVGANALVIVVALASWLPSLLAFRAPTYSLLTESSSTGCRVLVSETSFLLSGDGVAYAVPSSPIAVVYPQVRWITDDGAEPFSRGQGLLSWRSPTIAVVDGTDVLTEGPLAVDCER